MADEKKEEGTTFLNRGQRHFDIGKDAAGKTRRHSPGTTMTYTSEEAARASLYPKELVDVSKLPGQVDSSKLKAEAAKLKAENDALKAQLAALTPSGAAAPESELAAVGAGEAEATAEAAAPEEGRRKKK